VWIVTQRVDIKTDGVARLELKHYCSAVIDAITGVPTDDCIGCDWVLPAQASAAASGLLLET
jgi:hypothetical protein